MDFPGTCNADAISSLTGIRTNKLYKFEKMTYTVTGRKSALTEGITSEVFGINAWESPFFTVNDSRAKTLASTKIGAKEMTTVAMRENGKGMVIYSAIPYLNREGNGTPLQDSCLENPMDGGAW